MSTTAAKRKEAKRQQPTSGKVRPSRGTASKNSNPTRSESKVQQSAVAPGKTSARLGGETEPTSPKDEAVSTQATTESQQSDLATTAEVNEIIGEGRRLASIVAAIYAMCENHATGDSDDLVMTECQATTVMYLACTMDTIIEDIINCATRIHEAAAERYRQRNR